MKRLEEGSLEFLPQTDAAGSRASRKRDIDDNKNERLEVEEAPRVMEVAGMEGEAADDDGNMELMVVMEGHLNFNGGGTGNVDHINRS